MVVRITGYNPAISLDLFSAFENRGILLDSIKRFTREIFPCQFEKNVSVAIPHACNTRLGDVSYFPDEKRVVVRESA